MMGSELRRLKAQRPGVRILWRSSNIWKVGVGSVGTALS